MPHRADTAGPTRVAYGKHDSNMQAAGGIVASIPDLARFLVAVMADGRVDGRQIFPAELIAEARRIQARFSAKYGDIERFGYGLGWNYGMLDGDTLVHHFGGFIGFSAGVSYQPAHRLGVVIAGNGGNSTQVQDLVMALAYALLTGKDAVVARYRQRLADFPRLYEQQRSSIAADRARRAARPQTTALPLAAYAGRFADDSFGTLEVTLRDGRLIVRNGVMQSVAEVYDGTKHQFRVELGSTSGSVVEFQAADGRVTGASWAGRRFARTG